MTGRVRFAALGDSITVGMGDPMPDGNWRGWASLLADALGPVGEVEFHNLAASGGRAADVAGPQLAEALRLRPDVASVIVGVNDTLRRTFDVRAVGRSLDAAVGRLRAVGATVLTARLPDPGLMLGLPRALASPLGRRVQAVNAVADEVAARHGALHLDCGAVEGVYDRRLWSVDRLHPSERGHRLLAGKYWDLLAADGFAVGMRPSLEPASPDPTVWSQVRWMATKGTRWVRERGGDLLPHLLWMALTERWHALIGEQGQLDLRTRAEIAAALAMLGGEGTAWGDEVTA
jgi:lysophospholipase L1-like esterase